MYVYIYTLVLFLGRILFHSGYPPLGKRMYPKYNKYTQYIDKCTVADIPNIPNILTKIGRSAEAGTVGCREQEAVR